MGIAYAWEKMSSAFEALATAPEPLPERLEHALYPYFMNALYDAEIAHYLPVELLERMRRVSARVPPPSEGGHDVIVNMSRANAQALAKEIVAIAREIRRLSTH